VVEVVNGNPSSKSVVDDIPVVGAEGRLLVGVVAGFEGKDPQEARIKATGTIPTAPRSPSFLPETTMECTPKSGRAAQLLDGVILLSFHTALSAGRLGKVNRECLVKRTAEGGLLPEAVTQGRGNHPALR
jgi:hypothetical protein